MNILLFLYNVFLTLKKTKQNIERYLFSLAQSKDIRIVIVEVPTNLYIENHATFTYEI